MTGTALIADTLADVRVAQWPLTSGRSLGEARSHIDDVMLLAGPGVRDLVRLLTSALVSAALVRGRTSRMRLSVTASESTLHVDVCGSFPDRAITAVPYQTPVSYGDMVLVSRQADAWGTEQDSTTELGTLRLWFQLSL